MILPTFINHLLRRAEQQGLQRLEAQMLMLHVLGRDVHDRAWLLAHEQDGLPAEAFSYFEALCERRLAGEPMAYITGTKDFYGLKLQVNSSVLDPRPDTEVLVDWALDVLRADPQHKPLESGERPTDPPL